MTRKGTKSPPYRRQQTSPRPAPGPFVWTAQVAVVGYGVGSSAPLIIAPSPVARHTVATTLARKFSHLLGRGSGGFIRVAHCRRGYDRTCSVRGIRQRYRRSSATERKRGNHRSFVSCARALRLACSAQTTPLT